MESILLFSDEQKVYDVTKKIVDNRYILKWCPYDCLEKNEYPSSDVVIMYFSQDMMRLGVFEPIVKVKGKLGHDIPILCIVEMGSEQDKISVLNTGAYDYVDIGSDPREYQEKIDELIKWNWYLNKYKAYKKGQ